MWEERKLNIKNINYISYINNNSGSEIEELLFSTPNTARYFECIIRFTGADLADQFFDRFRELCPVYVYDPILFPEEGHRLCNDDEIRLNCIKFDLSKQKELDLEKLYQAFIRIEINSLPPEVLEIIKANPRQLSELEKTFYDMLPSINVDNFSTLLEMATSIATGYNSNALWELAQACKNAPAPLIEEWLQALKCINLHTNYYAKASEELAYFTLADYYDENPMPTEQQRTWLTNGLICATHMEHGGEELGKKIILTFLGENWSDKEKIFPTITYKNDVERAFSCHVDLIMYAKFLREENAKLKKEQDIKITGNPWKLDETYIKVKGAW